MSKRRSIALSLVFVLPLSFIALLSMKMWFTDEAALSPSRAEWREHAVSLQQQAVSKYSCLELTDGDTGTYFYRWYDSRKGMPDDQQDCVLNATAPEGYIDSLSNAEVEQHRRDVALEHGWNGGVVFYSSSRSRLYQLFCEETWLSANEYQRSDLSMVASDDFVSSPARAVVSDADVFVDLSEAVERQRYRR